MPTWYDNTLACMMFQCVQKRGMTIIIGNLEKKNRNMAVIVHVTVSIEKCSVLAAYFLSFCNM